jgi:hypothetical protein
MTKKAKALKAVETKSSIHACIELFETHFAAGSEKIYGLPDGAFWQPRHGVWGHFSESGKRRPPSKYWNVFGLHPSRLRQNIVVEINPPGAGKHAGRQGVVATDKDGDRWILHQGRLHPKGTRITEAMFDEVVQTPRWQVHYMDGSTLSCHPVANLDAHTDVALQQVAAFVRLCMRTRVHHQVGPVQSEFLKNVETREGPSHPETAGSYDRSSTPATVAEKRHADNWRALTTKLNEWKVDHSNARIGRYGPDLLAFRNDKRTLFEIKSDATASDIHGATGQLKLYETLGGKPCRKVMVLPNAPSKPIAGALAKLEIEVLLFDRQGKVISFDAEKLKAVLG